jgi:hypothetical protein
MKPNLPTLSLSAIALAVASVALTPAVVRAGGGCVIGNFCMTPGLQSIGSCTQNISTQTCGCNSSGWIYPPAIGYCTNVY